MGDAQLRASLLGVKGVGEETADDILLYAYHRGVFIYMLMRAGFSQRLDGEITPPMRKHVKRAMNASVLKY